MRELGELILLGSKTDFSSSSIYLTSWLRRNSSLQSIYRIWESLRLIIFVIIFLPFLIVLCF
jgi:hypothetical protein